MDGLWATGMVGLGLECLLVRGKVGLGLECLLVRGKVGLGLRCLLFRGKVGLCWWRLRSGDGSRSGGCRVGSEYICSWTSHSRT